MPYVYVLHFDRKLAHAAHYTGCTQHLTDRLEAHASGAGSNLCRVLKEAGIGWRLGGLYLCKADDMRRAERYIKSRRSKRYCSLCSPVPARIPGTTNLEIELFTSQRNGDTKCM